MSTYRRYRVITPVGVGSAILRGDASHVPLPVPGDSVEISEAMAAQVAPAMVEVLRASNVTCAPAVSIDAILTVAVAAKLIRGD